MLSKDKISSLLKNNADNYILNVQDEVTSTNTVLKELAKTGEKRNIILVANMQTNGRGRMGRSFFSPQNSGIYMSILFHPDIFADDAIFITTSAAVAVSGAIEAVCGKKTQIKWVNDIYIEDKKVCGILAESQTDFKSGKMDFVVLGIGVNIFKPENGFPEELKNIAASIMETKNSENIKNELAAEIINNLCSCIDDIKNKTYIDEYKERSYLIGKEIYVIKGDVKKEAVAVEIDDEARLIVEYPDKTRETLSYGEVSAKMR